MIDFEAKIDPLADSSIRPFSWFITHGLGTPAAGLFTEVAFWDGLNELTVAQQDSIVRQVADKLYGRRWAFHYEPDAYEDAIEKYGLVRRERVVVTGIEAY